MPDSHLIERPGILNTLNGVVTMPVAGYGGVAFQVQGSFSGTITFETSVHGQEFVPMRVVEPDNSTAVTTTTAAGIFVGSTVGMTAVRARMSSYSSGAASLLIRATAASPGGSGGGGGVGSDVNLIEVGGETIELGQAAMAASIPVVIASDQTPVPITGSISATNPSVSATGSPVPTDATYIGVLDPDGNLTGFSAETFDYDSGGGTAAQTTVGIAIPASGGALPVLGGSGVSSGALRVELPTNGTGVIATVGAVTAVTTITNPVTVVQATATSLKAEVIGAGSAGTANAGVVTIQGITSMTPVLVNQPTGTNLHTVIDSGTVTAVTSITNAVTVVGNVAADAADSGNPVKIGMIAYSPDGTTPGTAVAELDRSNAKSDLDGRLYVNTASPRMLSVHLDGSSAYTDQALFADPGDGFQVVMTSIQISTGAATALNMFLEEGSTKVWGPVYLQAVAGVGYVSGPIHKPFTASTAVTVTTSASIAQSIDATYYVQAI